MKKAIFAVLLAAVLCFGAFSVVGRADFGDFGGDSDYGGGWDSGWDSGDSGWDSGDSGWDWDDDDDDYDYDYDYGGWGSGYTSSSGGDYEFSETTEIVLGAVFLILLVLGFIWLVKKIVGFFGGKGKSKKSGPYPERQKKVWKQAQRRPGGSPGSGVAPYRSGAVPTGASGLNPIADYKALDPGFNPAAFKEQLSNRYVQFQNAWQAKDLSPLRPYLTDALFAQMDRQLENNYRKTRQTNRVERIAVLGVNLVGWRQSAGADEIVARLRTRIVDYVVSDDTGAVVRGSATAEKFMEYEWTLTRASGIVTGQTDGATVHNCPNCGAVMNINQTARCEYCGSIVTVEAHEWAVTNIKGISQRTGS